MKISTKDKGDRGELIAVEFFKNINYNIIKRNYKTPFGEIDIIAEDNDEIVFIEVKSSYDEERENPLYNITPKKLRHIFKAGQWYIKEYKCNKNYRFDFVSIIFQKDGKKKIEHIKGI
ncbi:MAG: YraN family protein [Candidatus Hydrogenedentota bacterium]